jgi:hypothetical protein
VYKREATEGPGGRAEERYRPLSAGPSEPGVAEITRLITRAGSNDA